MARALWKGAIGFGLVNVPVRLHEAVHPQAVRFHQLHDADGGRIRMKRVCSIDGEEVPYDHVVKGFEVSRGHYVRVEPNELEKLDPHATHSIDIEQFAQLEEVDPLLYDTSYRVAADRGGARALRLLVDAMEKSGRVGIGRLVLRTRSHLCLLRVLDGALILTTLHYADELVAAEEEASEERGRAPTERERALAQDLVDSMTLPFDARKYRDDYRDKVIELVEAKSEGEEIIAPTEEAPARVINLMDALRRSIEQTGKKEAPARGERRTRAETKRPAARTRKARTTKKRRA